MDLAADLEAGRRDFLDAVRAVSPQHASAKPGPNGWSVLECIEHVAAVEDRYLSWLDSAAAIAPRRDTRKELRLFATVRNRFNRMETPDVLRPCGRFATLADALAGFEAVRDRTVQAARERGEALCSMGIAHPHFGKLNCVELMQLIDAHARRHADQIRETSEALQKAPEVRPKPASRRKAVAFRRDEPDLPAELEPFGEGGRLAVQGDSVALQEKRLQDVDGTNLQARSLRIDGCVLEGVPLAGGQFESLVWKDVRLIGCDLANIQAHRMSLARVALIDCRLTGITATALDWQDVLVQGGDVRYAQFREGKFRSCEFVECNWQEADLQNADLSGTVFRSCRLSRADLHGAKLRNTDFRKSEVEGLLVGVNDLRGAIVDPAQAMILAGLMGLEIR